jgi:hypothetical protein
MTTHSTIGSGPMTDGETGSWTIRRIALAPAQLE